ncbi:MAG: hypothetical protein LAO20_16760 [Acidobacteriia bacterium]|nr:hypothetical protein [Terriglobia bacterium]
MNRIREFLKGKKTYLSAAGLAIVAGLGWWFNAFNGTVATGMLAMAAGLAGLGAKSDRAAQMTMIALEDVRRVAQSKQPLTGAQIATIVGDVIAGATKAGLSITPPGAPVPVNVAAPTTGVAVFNPKSTAGK